MKLRRNRHSRGAGFTLLELLVVIVIIAVLASIILSVFSRTKQSADEVKTLSNMRQMGVAMLAYANDNNYQLPSRTTSSPDGTGTVQKWPVLLFPYLQDARIYYSPVPNDSFGNSYKVSNLNAYTNSGSNTTSYIYNGMNDVIPLGDQTSTVRTNMIAQSSETILLGIPYAQKNQFYMDFGEGGGNNNDILNKSAFPNGSIYVFSDGSSRVLVNNQNSTTYQKQRPPNSGTYTDWLWLVDKSQTSAIQ